MEQEYRGEGGTGCGAGYKTEHGTGQIRSDPTGPALSPFFPHPPPPCPPRGPKALHWAQLDF